MEKINCTYTICTISTTDLEKYKRVKEFYNATTYSHMDIYLAGVEVLSKNNSNNA